MKSEKGDITINPTDINRIMGDQQEQWYSSKHKKYKQTGKFLEKQ